MTTKSSTGKLALPTPAEPSAVNPLVLSIFNTPSPVKKKSPPPPPPSPRGPRDEAKKRPTTAANEKKTTSKKSKPEKAKEDASGGDGKKKRKRNNKANQDDEKDGEGQVEEKKGKKAKKEEAKEAEEDAEEDKGDVDGAEEEGDDANEDGEMEEMTEEMKKENTIFVGNVPVSMTKKALKKIFAEYGKIHSIRFRSVAFALPKRRKEDKKAAFLGKHFHPERTTCNAYIVYKDKDSAIKALAANNTKLDDGDTHTYLSVDLAYSPTWNMARSAFVGNLPFSIQEEELRSHFASAGTIKRVRIVRDSATFIGKGFGFIEFENKDDLLGALALHESELQGRKIRVFKASSYQADKKRPSQGGKSNKEGRSYQGLEAAPGAALRLARKRKSLEGGGKPKKAGGNKKGKKSKKPRTA